MADICVGLVQQKNDLFYQSVYWRSYNALSLIMLTYCLGVSEPQGATLSPLGKKILWAILYFVSDPNFAFYFGQQ